MAPSRLASTTSTSSLSAPAAEASGPLASPPISGLKLRFASCRLLPSPPTPPAALAARNNLILNLFCFIRCYCGSITTS